MRRTATQAFLALALLGSPGLVKSATACPNCKEAVAAQPEEAASVARGYNWSVLFMVGMPFTLLGTGAVVIARGVKKGILPEL